MYGPIGGVTENFWRIRTFASCESNIAKSVLSLDEAIAAAIATSLKQLSHYLSTFDQLLPSQLALSTILWQISEYGESRKYWVGTSSEQRLRNMLEFLEYAFRVSCVKDYFLPEMNLLCRV